MTIEQTRSRRFSIESCTVTSSLALDIYNHCTVYNSPPTTLAAGILLAQTARPSSSSPSSVIRINCYKGNICTPQILLVLVGKILPLFPHPPPEDIQDHRRRKSNSNWETTAYKYTIMLSHSFNCSSSSYKRRKDSFSPLQTLVLFV